MIRGHLDARHLRRIHNQARGWATGRVLIVHLAERRCAWRVELYDGQPVGQRVVRLAVKHRDLTTQEAANLLRTARR